MFRSLFSQQQVRTWPKSDFWFNFARFGSKADFLRYFHNGSAWIGMGPAKNPKRQNHENDKPAERHPSPLWAGPAGTLFVMRNWKHLVGIPLGISRGFLYNFLMAVTARRPPGFPRLPPGGSPGFRRQKPDARNQSFDRGAQKTLFSKKKNVVFDQQTDLDSKNPEKSGNNFL